jgi:hypothetical protein
MNQRRLLIGGLVAIGLVLYWAWTRHLSFPSQSGQSSSDDATVERSGESFTAGNLYVIIDYGYSDDGDRLRYVVIRAFPTTSTADERFADKRYDLNPGGLPLVRQSDGKMAPTRTDGRVYLYIGDELRTMRVKMNEHTDTMGLREASSLEAMWDYLGRFRVPDGN